MSNLFADGIDLLTTLDLPMLEVSVARSARDGLPARAENVAGQVADLAAEFCVPCGRVHQLREQQVPCRVCRRWTFDVHAVCASCREVGDS